MPERLLFEEVRQQLRPKGTSLPTLGEAGYMLLVNDETRQGALRFRDQGGFLSKRAGIRDLQALAEEARIFAETGYVDEENTLLMGAGSSPGGAQPKAWVRDDGARCCLRSSRRVPISGTHSYAKWWPSTSSRVQVCIRTALQWDTSAHPDYAKIATEIAAISSAPSQDANELFSRAAFIAMVNNTDDHMRNHCLLLTGKGWRLSPSFDVNPMSSGVSEPPLTPGGNLGDRDVRGLLDYASEFERLRLVGEAIPREAWALAQTPWGTWSVRSRAKTPHGSDLWDRHRM
ncbi:UNVERIFIED_ORG: hypothetical protein ABIB19_003307 [Arthrobacter sp. UYEF10]